MAAALSMPAVRAGEPSENAGPAKEAYDRGTAAYRKGDYTLAAVEYARADELIPNDTALQASLEAAVLTDELILGMELLERSKRGPASGSLLEAIKAARAKFTGRAGRVRVVCGNTPCQARVDGAAIDVRTAPWFRSGAHKVTLLVGDRQEERSIEVAPDTVTELTPAERPAARSAVPTAAPPPTAALIAPSASPSPSGISPAWFWIGAGATAVLGGVSIWSGLDTSDKHKSFDDSRCNQVPNSKCSTMATDGTSAQNRTNLLLGATALAGVATGVMGLWLVRWNSKSTAAPSVGLSPAQATFHMSF